MYAAFKALQRYFTRANSISILISNSQILSAASDIVSQHTLHFSYSWVDSDSSIS